MSINGEPPPPDQSVELKTALKFVQEHPGLYWFTDSAAPGQSVACVSINGHIHQLKMDGELRPQYFQNTALFSGPLPFTA